MQDRDSCWLKKKIHIEELKTFSISESDNVAKTLINEMVYLFPNVKKVEVDAAINFTIIEETTLGDEGYRIKETEKGFLITGQTSRALLYGMYTLHQKLLIGNTLINEKFVPDQALRMINHWDNMDGTIERGYAGESIFYKDNEFRKDYKTLREYARLLASVGINALTINNVNVHKNETELILNKNLDEVKKINDIFSSFGIQTFLSINFASPKILGGLDTADPLDNQVIVFWKEIINNIYQIIPNFGGFVVKADSEGEPGPFTYGRNHDEGANLFGRLLKPHGGRCIWRCFVYNHKQNWRDRSIDRARAAYDHFMPLDGNFEENVSLQIKIGPLDFQVREPLSPLFGALRKTNHLIEFQLTQEYTGHQKAIYYQNPVWKEALDFDCKYEDNPGTVKELLKVNSPNQTNSGICAVGVVGMDNNWTGHKLMQINLYAYGRLCWDNELTSDEISREWIELSFELESENFEKLNEILMTSRETYSLYTAPRGVGFMVKPNLHDGPDIDGYEYSSWGTYHFADCYGIGNDRTTEGTGFVTQYSKENCEMYNSLETCPDELLLWFHHVPYSHLLHNGKTMIQDIYDTHFEGVERVRIYQEQFTTMKSELDNLSYENVTRLLDWQYDLAVEWRDQINTYFYRKSGVKDSHGRKIYA